MQQLGFVARRQARRGLELEDASPRDDCVEEICLFKAAMRDPNQNLESDVAATEGERLFVDALVEEPAYLFPNGEDIGKDLVGQFAEALPVDRS